MNKAVITLSGIHQALGTEAWNELMASACKIPECYENN